MKRTILLFAGMLVFGLPQAVSGGELANSIGMVFVEIPAGTYAMGSCKVTDAQSRINLERVHRGDKPLTMVCPSGAEKDGDASDNETPQHLVRLNGFQMGKYEVTLGQFKKFIAAAGRTDLNNANFIKTNKFGDNSPVVMVSWQDAQDFVAWLNASDKSSRYSLSSEAQWEYAARAGSITPHPYKGKHGDYAWYANNSDNHRHDAGKKLPNGFGLHDMAGNVWEWTQDCWNSSYKRAPADGSANNEGDCRFRVLRGGAWYEELDNLRPGNRYTDNADYRFYAIGFRVVRTVADPR